MTNSGSIFIVIGIVTLVSCGLAYAFRLSEFKKAMNQYDPQALFKLGMDTASDLLGPSYGTKEAQSFFLKKRYLKHPSPAVVNVVLPRFHGHSVKDSFLLLS
jgi:hypothetical protein